MGEVALTLSLSAPRRFAPGIAAVIGWSIIAAVAILFGVKAVVGLRASPEHINDDLDLTHHGERAFTP